MSHKKENTLMDMTAGCTKQACAFGELYPRFREKGAVVPGISISFGAAAAGT